MSSSFLKYDGLVFQEKENKPKQFMDIGLQKKKKRNMKTCPWRQRACRCISILEHHSFSSRRVCLGAGKSMDTLSCTCCCMKTAHMVRHSRPLSGYRLASAEPEVLGSPAYDYDHAGPASHRRLSVRHRQGVGVPSFASWTAGWVVTVSERR